MAHQCRVRFLVALPPASDLLLCAKHLFVTASGGSAPRTALGRLSQPERHSRETSEPCNGACRRGTDDRRSNPRVLASGERGTHKPRWHALAAAVAVAAAIMIAMMVLVMTSPPWWSGRS